MPLQSRIAHKCNKLTQAYLKGEQLLLEFVADGKHHTVRILRRGQRSLIDELRSHLCSYSAKKRFSISVESMNGDSYIIEDHAAFVQHVSRHPHTPSAAVHPQNNTNPMIDFFADHGSWLPPASKRIYVISPLIGAIASKTILEEDEEEEGEEEEEEEEDEVPSELITTICHQSDAPSSPPQAQPPHTTRPTSYNPQIALQALYTTSAYPSTLSPTQLPSTLRIETARPNASAEMAQPASPAPRKRSGTSHEALQDLARNDEFSQFQASIPADVRESMERVGGVARSRRAAYCGV